MMSSPPLSDGAAESAPPVETSAAPAEADGD
jgi:hypothetical protein